VSGAEHLTRRDFFHDLELALGPLLPEPLRAYQSSATHNLLKLYYGERRLHFEVWANARDRQIELGLHFEDGPESTKRLIRYFDGHIVELKHLLGPELELERWTNSWGHLYQVIPYQPLTDPLVAEIAGRLARMIALLQPLLAEAEPRARPRSPRRVLLATSAIS
jgi:hypothetical protein